MKKKVPQLPDKPSDLIDLAIHDLKLVLRSKKYQVDMGVYHLAAEAEEPCCVCFAGSVMAKTCKADPEESLYTSSFGPKNQKKFRALNLFRMGNIVLGLETLGIKIPVLLETVEWGAAEFNQCNPKPFIDSMKDLAKALREVGL